MGSSTGAALQVIVLGSGGGPQESNTTAFLVRSVSQNWARGSLIAVDAGVHLSAITRLIQEAFPSPPPASLPYTLTRGPFAGLSLPYSTPAANAAHVTRTLVDTYLITHPHLDHISGFVVNTAGLPGTRPKKLAGLPSTIQAFKNHIFNNIIWPNLSDENNGAGLLTYLRLVEGGSPALGEGKGKGYLEVCDGLLVKTWCVSHGHCIEKHSHRGSTHSAASPPFGSYDALSQTSRRDTHSLGPSQSLARGHASISQATLSGGSPPRSGIGEVDQYCVYDSSAYFIQDQEHTREVLIFGDVEPDSISLNPRNLLVWQEAAPKIVHGTLTAILIECSYDDSQSDDRLFGHLKPLFIMEELQVLANEMERVRKAPSPIASKKRKRMSLADSQIDIQHCNSISKRNSIVEDPVSPKSVTPSPTGRGEQCDALHCLATPIDELSYPDEGIRDPRLHQSRRPLKGLKIIIIHVKEKLADGPDAGATILQQLRDHERELRLGCEFVISKPGQSFYL